MTREHHDKLQHRVKVLRALADDPGAAAPERESARRKAAEIEAELAAAQVEPAPPSSPRRGYDLRDDIPFTEWGPRFSTAPRAASPPPPAPDVEPPPPPVSPVGHYGVPSSTGAPRRSGPGNGPFGGGGPLGGGGGIF